MGAAGGGQRGGCRDRGDARVVCGRAATHWAGCGGLHAGGWRGPRAGPAGLLRAGAGAHAGRQRRRAGGDRRVLRRCRPGLLHRSGVLRGLRHARGGVRGGGALGNGFPVAARRAGREAGPRRRDAQPRAGLCRRDPRRPADLDARVPGAVGAARPGAARGRAASQRRPRRCAPAAWRRGRRAVLPRRHRGRGQRVAGCARGRARGGGAGRLRGDRAPAAGHDLSRPRGPDQPAALGRRHAARLFAGSAGPPARAAAGGRRDRRDGSRSGRAHARVRGGPGRGGLSGALPDLETSAPRPTSRCSTARGLPAASPAPTARARGWSCRAPGCTSTT